MLSNQCRHDKPQRQHSKNDDNAVCISIHYTAVLATVNLMKLHQI